MTPPDPSAEPDVEPDVHGPGVDDAAVPEAPADTSIRAALSPQLVRLLIGVGFSSLGGGLVIALFVVYLHEVRGISLKAAGLLLAYQAVLGLVLAPLVGWLVDRIGPRPVLGTALVVETVGVFSFGFVTTVPQAAAAATVMAMGNAGLWAPQSALLARLSTPEHRQRVFGLNFMLLNLGLGLGGLIGASVLDETRPSTFTWLYAFDAASFLVYLAAVISLRGVNGPEARPADDTDGPGGYREVLGDRRMRRYLVGALVLMTAGYGSMDAGLPPFMTTVVGLPVNAIGVVFFLNTLIIVVLQVWVLKRIEGRSRTRLLAVTAVLWSSFWVVVAVSAGFDGWTAGVLIALGFGVFAVGETIFSPVAPSLINAFAPPHLRGRYNAVGGLVWGVSGSLGPMIAGLMIGTGLGVAWAVTLAVGALVAGLLLASLRPLLSPEEDGRSAPVPSSAVGMSG
ncbi:MAG: MFS transporter [Candidatus Nanopelagicales bacterium]